MLNGCDLASYAANDVRSVIGGCPQDPHLFNATIRDNLSLARPGATGAELEAAAARARLLPGSPLSPWAGTPRSAPAERPSPAANGSASRWPARS